MNPRRCILAVLASTTLAAAAPSQEPPAPQAELIRDRADRLLEDLHRRGLFNGAVVLGTDRELYARGFGPANVAAGVAFTPDTPADAGSIAKTFAAASLLALVDEGRVGLDDPVVKYPAAARQSPERRRLRRPRREFPAPWLCVRAARTRAARQRVCVA